MARRLRAIVGANDGGRRRDTPAVTVFATPVAALAAVLSRGGAGGRCVVVAATVLATVVAGATVAAAVLALDRRRRRVDRPPVGGDGRGRRDGRGRGGGRRGGGRLGIGHVHPDVFDDLRDAVLDGCRQRAGHAQPTERHPGHGAGDGTPQRPRTGPAGRGGHDRRDAFA